jgi:hypothetical protein
MTNMSSSSGIGKALWDVYNVSLLVESRPRTKVESKAVLNYLLNHDLKDDKHFDAILEPAELERMASLAPPIYCRWGASLASPIDGR